MAKYTRFKVGDLVRQKPVPYSWYRGGVNYHYRNDKIGVVVSFSGLYDIMVDFFDSPKHIPISSCYPKRSRFLEKVEVAHKIDKEYEDLYA